MPNKQEHNKQEHIEIYFDEIILDSNLYKGKGDVFLNEKDFEKGDLIIYFRGNFTWRAEVIRQTSDGYIVKDL